jgi:hypothetical protein
VGTIGKGPGQHSLLTQVRLLGTDPPPPPTWPHLNSVYPGVEEGGPRTLGGRGVGRATAATAVVVVVILLLVGLLLLLRALLGQLLS